MKLELCSFSGYKIYPGHGKLYVRLDSRSFRFLNGKCASLFLQRKNPRKVHWTVVFRKMHKKGITEEVAKKRTRKTVKFQRSVVGATFDEIKAKRNQKPEERAAMRLEAINKAKDAKNKKMAAKKVAAPAQKIKMPKQVKVKQAKNQASAKR